MLYITNLSSKLQKLNYIVLTVQKSIFSQTEYGIIACNLPKNFF